MKKGNIQSVMSENLLTKDVYGICFTERETLDCKIDNFFAARRRFLQSDKKRVKVNEKQIVMGMAGEVKIKFSSRNLLFKKTAGKIVVEESYQAPIGFVVVRRNLDNFITSKIFFDKDHQWIKSEYFDAPDTTIAQVIFKPITSNDAIERFDYNPAIKGYSQTVLFPSPYVENDVACRIIDEKIGKPDLIVLTENGRFCYTLESVARKRLEMRKEIKTDDVQKVLSWAEDPGVVKKAQADLVVSFSAIDKVGKVKKIENNQQLPAKKPKAQPKLDVKSSNLKYDGAAFIKNSIENISLNNKFEQRNTVSKDKYVARNTFKREKLLTAAERAKAGEIALKEKEVSELPLEMPVKEKYIKSKKSIDIDKEFDEILKTAKYAAKKRYIKSQINGEKLFNNPVELKKELEKNPVLKTLIPSLLNEKADINAELSKEPPAKYALNEADEEKIEVRKRRESYDLEKEFGSILAQARLSLNTYGETLEAETAKKKANDEKEIKKVFLKSTKTETKPKVNNPRQEIYRASVVDGKIAGITGSKKQLNESCYEGEMMEGKRHGFGVSYSTSGSVVYAGFWENDKKNGLGISFRESDHAVHIAHWSDNKPDSFVSLFDTKGNLQYSGSVNDGKKNGVGISYRLEDGSVFVGKWEKGKSTGFGSVFDKKGNLIYTGMWKNGKRNGIGSEFNNKGEVIFTGEWKDDVHHNGILYKRPDETKKITG